MWLISDSDYERMKRANVPISPSIDLNQLRTKFIQDRVLNQVRDDNMWNKLTDRIKPLLQAQHSTTLPPPHAPPPPSSPTGTTASGPQFFSPSSTPQRSPQLSISEGEGEEEEEEEEEEQGQETEEQALRIITEEVTIAKFRPNVERLFKMLIAQPEVHITSNWVYVNEQQCVGRSSMLLTNLVKPNKTFKYMINGELLDVLAKIPGILNVVQNEQAQGEIKRRQLQSAQPDREQRRRESMTNLKNWGAAYGLLPIDESIPLPDDEVEGLLRSPPVGAYVPSPKKGSGGKIKRGRIQWKSLFR